jgi:hypothetical protein
VFDGIGALFVRCDNDPFVQAAKIPGLTWCAYKVGGPDASTVEDVKLWVHRMRARPVGASWTAVGVWVYCAGPPAEDVRLVADCYSEWPGHPALVVYNVEAAYKSDEGGHREWAAELVAEHRKELGSLPAAVTSYGSYKTSIGHRAFAHAGWPMFAQVGGDYHDPEGAEESYRAVYPTSGIHRLVRRLALARGEAVYRPEGLA